MGQAHYRQAYRCRSSRAANALRFHCRTNGKPGTDAVRQLLRGVVADAAPAEVLEPGVLRRVYGVDVQVGILRGAEHISVLPPGSEIAEEDLFRERGPRPLVHVMAGGGTGEMMMRALADAHIPFIAGALNIGDSDHTLALRLASEVITEQPYAPISQLIQKQVRASLAAVKLLIICPMPIGPGNLALLQEAVVAGQRGLPVLLLHTTDIAKRDYTDGEGQQLLDALVRMGAKTVTSVGGAMDIVKQL